MNQTNLPPGTYTPEEFGLSLVSEENGQAEYVDANGQVHVFLPGVQRIIHVTSGDEIVTRNSDCLSIC